MTKIHETFYRLDLESFDGLGKSVKGEITVVLSKKNMKNSNKILLDKENLNREIVKYLKRYTLKDVAKLISEKNDLPKNKVYEMCLKIKKK